MRRARRPVKLSDPFNSLFEMHIKAELRLRRLKYKLAFNSLFEMLLFEQVLQCGVYRGFQFSI